MSQCIASDKQQVLPLSGDETLTGLQRNDTPVNHHLLMERVLERGNLFRALQKVQRNKGGAGIDGMTVDDLPAFLKLHWPSIKEQLINGNYQPKAVKRVLIPKSDGSKRKLGIPTVLDRLIQQALLQILQPEWDQTFSHFSFGFRPRRSAHQAVKLSEIYVNDNRHWVVDMDLEKFFDKVNHDVLMHRVKQRVKDKRVLKLINRYLNAGALVNDQWVEAKEGTPQGGPLSPLLANLLLDDLDKELESRDLKFVRYADDCNIYVRSERAGHRVLSSITQWLKKQLKLTVNANKSAVDRPWKRRFLGFTFTARGSNKRIKVSDKAFKQFKYNIRAITRRTRGRTLNHIVSDLRSYLLGWKGYFGFSEVKSTMIDLDKWIRRKLRCYILKQWGRSGYRRLRKLGIGRRGAWNVAKSARGPWRLSNHITVRKGLSNKYFKELGVPSLVEC
ncbi:MAG: group II intron reverse transcriptase/maturase [Enterobacterales bacterium]|nr:group II intron reverse transcriptase/maturase [Enterobacterales bacterium]